jgi:glycosyltransferase involved in cell wall biosynthesis
MRIIIFCTHFYPYKGGLENYVLQIASRLAKKGVKIDVLTYNDKKLKEFERYRGIGIYRIPCWNILGEVYSIPILNRKTKAILERLARKNYDFVITQTRFFTSSWLGMNFAKKHGFTFVHTEHGNVHVKHPNKLIGLSAWIYDQTIGRKIFRSSWKTIGVSKACCNFARRLGAKRCFVVHNSINPGFFQKKPAVRNRTRELLRIKKSERAVIFVGRLIYAKGVQDLISAMKGLKDVKLIVVGEGPYKKDLMKLSKEKDVNSLFTGSKDLEKIADILNAGDIFVNPSFSEGLPTSVLEAGAAGLSVIATAVGGTTEIVDNNVSGFLVKPQDVSQLREKLIKLLKSKALRKKFGKNLRKNIENKFDWDKSVEKMLKVLKEK